MRRQSNEATISDLTVADVGAGVVDGDVVVVGVIAAVVVVGVVVSGGEVACSVGFVVGSVTGAKEPCVGIGWTEDPGSPVFKKRFSNRSTALSTTSL